MFLAPGYTVTKSSCGFTNVRFRPSNCPGVGTYRCPRGLERSMTVEKIVRRVAANSDARLLLFLGQSRGPPRSITVVASKPTLDKSMKGP